MARTFYQYNAETCRYEAIPRNRRKVALNTTIFLFLSFVIAFGSFFFHFRFADSLTELWLSNRNAILKKEFMLLSRKTDVAFEKLSGLIDKDDNNYRVILDAQPLAVSIREAGSGGSEKLTLSDADNLSVIYEQYLRIGKLRKQADIEVQSYEEIETLLDEKVKMWASRPAIQPVDNRQLDQLHLTYGLRMHPIFKTLKDHKGLDFTAPRGTPVYATGDGIVQKAHFSGTYGNVVYIDHQYGFETRYAHLSRFAVKEGDHVKRGQIIGNVGNTGNSVSAHLHYEVLIAGKNVNPINFFQRDISNDEYEKLIQLGSRNAGPLD
jgi:murein DD-endopeptidase MepM/ murein hydrolase activator NlpD